MTCCGGKGVLHAWLQGRCLLFSRQEIFSKAWQSSDFDLW